MCLNFLLTANTAWVTEHFSVNLPKMTEREIYPDGTCPIIRSTIDKSVFRCDIAKFGLIPPWTRHARNRAAKVIPRNQLKGAHHDQPHVETYNARIETIATKPSFRNAWNHKHFAIIVIDSFFQPYYANKKPVRWTVFQQNGMPLGLGCLWEMSHDFDLGVDVLSFCILPRDASHDPLLNQFHRPDQPKRGPLIIPEPLLVQWLNANLTQANTILLTDHDIHLNAHAVNVYQ